MSQEQWSSLLGPGKPRFRRYAIEPVHVKFLHILSAKPRGEVITENIDK